MNQVRLGMPADFHESFPGIVRVESFIHSDAEPLPMEPEFDSAVDAFEVVTRINNKWFDLPEHMSPEDLHDYNRAMAFLDIAAKGYFRNPEAVLPDWYMYVHQQRNQSFDGEVQSV